MVRGKAHNNKTLSRLKLLNATIRDNEKLSHGDLIGGTQVEDGQKPMKSAAGADNWLNLRVSRNSPAHCCMGAFRGTTTKVGWCGMPVHRELGKADNLSTLHSNQVLTVSVQRQPRA